MFWFTHQILHPIILVGKEAVEQNHLWQSVAVERLPTNVTCTLTAITKTTSKEKKLGFERYNVGYTSPLMIKN